VERDSNVARSKHEKCQASRAKRVHNDVSSQ